MTFQSTHLSRLSVCPVCKEAKADLVFLVDGSWSIGDDNFMKITRFLYSTMGSLDLIGPDGTQVSHM